jgi:hypothetical protein
MGVIELAAFALTSITCSADAPHRAVDPHSQSQPETAQPPRVLDVPSSASSSQLTPPASLELRDKVLIASVMVAVGALAASIYFNIRTVELTRRRDNRDALFKALDGYLRTRELRSKAERETDPSKAWENWAEYYRVLFDLHWSEFYVWSGEAIADAPYEEWMKQLRQDFKEHKTAKNAVPQIGIHIAWDELRDKKYFDDNDEFVRHMDLVRAGQIDEAMSRKHR